MIYRFDNRCFLIFSVFNFLVVSNRNHLSEFCDSIAIYRALMFFVFFVNENYFFSRISPWHPSRWDLGGEWESRFSPDAAQPSPARSTSQQFVHVERVLEQLGAKATTALSIVRLCWSHCADTSGTHCCGLNTCGVPWHPPPPLAPPGHKQIASWPVQQWPQAWREGVMVVTAPCCMVWFGSKVVYIYLRSALLSFEWMKDGSCSRLNSFVL